MIALSQLESPVGPLSVAERAGRVCLLHFGPIDDQVEAVLARWYPGEPRARRGLPAIAPQMTSYFAGEIRAIDDVPVELNGTEFQKSVWSALRRIPAGTTISYAELAKRIGQRAAVRAVGTANGANPVAIVVPCHRVIGSDGSLTGYGGGLDRKRWLLTLEGVTTPTLF